MKKTTQYARGKKAASQILQKYNFIARLVREDSLMKAIEASEGLLYIAWRRGYDAARRDGKRSTK